ncbi:MAG: hypothetical protein KDJ44_18525 [Rhodoblastus sp.]|nr:hypothetical protein [Rhodoblastus sp.]
MALFQAALCRIQEGNLVPYEHETIQMDSAPDAIEKAKQWAQSIDDREDAWLQVLFDGKSIASMKQIRSWR